MAIITLTTDFGENDFHVSSLKGAIYSLMPEAVVIDISHQVSPFDLLQTAYLVRNNQEVFTYKNKNYRINTEVQSRGVNFK